MPTTQTDDQGSDDDDSDEAPEPPADGEVSADEQAELDGQETPPDVAAGFEPTDLAFINQKQR